MASKSNMARSAAKKQHGNREAFCVKVALRLATLKENATVLDCYAGDHDIWMAIKNFRPDVTVVHIEADRKRAGATDLPGDNRKYLTTMDLSGFDAVDLDAWGYPADQLEMISRNHFDGVIWWTCIRRGMGVNKVMAATRGYPSEWLNIAQSLFLGDHLPSWFQFLGNLGFEDVVCCELDPMTLYGAVNVAEPISDEIWHRLLRRVILTPVGALT